MSAVNEVISVRDAAPSSAEILALLSVAELKANERIVHSAEDTIFEDCILEAYDWLAGASGWLGRSVLTETWTCKLPGFQAIEFGSDSSSRPTIEWVDTGVILLPRPALASLVSVKYRDEDNVLTTLSDASVSPPVTSSVFHVVTGGTFGMLALASGEEWPVTYDRPDAVEIKYTTGFGNGAAVKATHRSLVKALKLLAGDFYQNREATYAEPRLVQVNRAIINGVEKLAGQYRVPRALL